MLLLFSESIPYLTMPLCTSHFINLEGTTSHVPEMDLGSGPDGRCRSGTPEPIVCKSKWNRTTPRSKWFKQEAEIIAVRIYISIHLWENSFVWLVSQGSSMTAPVLFNTFSIVIDSLCTHQILFLQCRLKFRFHERQVRQKIISIGSTLPKGQLKL